MGVDHADVLPDGDDTVTVTDPSTVAEVNKNLSDKGMRFVETTSDGGKAPLHYTFTAHLRNPQRRNRRAFSFTRRVVAMTWPCVASGLLGS